MTAQGIPSNAFALPRILSCCQDEEWGWGGCLGPPSSPPVCSLSLGWGELLMRAERGPGGEGAGPQTKVWPVVCVYLRASSATPEGPLHVLAGCMSHSYDSGPLRTLRGCF